MCLVYSLALRLLLSRNVYGKAYRVHQGGWCVTAIKTWLQVINNWAVKVIGF